MFSSLRNYSKNIHQSQRFYYENYDYYNIYQNIEKEYSHDLSKFVYHCNRKSTPSIISYGSQKSMRIRHTRFVKGLGEYRTMEDFLNGFINIYIENNYCSTSRVLEKQPCVQNFQLMHFSSLTNLKYDKQYCPFRTATISKDDLAQIFSTLMQTSKLIMQKLQQQYDESEQNRARKVSHVQFLYGMERYVQKILAQNYENTESEAFLLYYQFVVEVHRVMFDLVNSRIRTILLMAQPKIKYLNTFVHPLLIPITSFLKMEVQKVTIQSNLTSAQIFKLLNSVPSQKPKIAFINLDGKQSGHNLRSIAALKQQMLYISLYNEPSWIQKKQATIQNFFNSNDEFFEPTYAKLWQIYSESIIREFNQASKSSEPKIMLFPLNSTYLIKKYIYKLLQSNPNTNVSDWAHRKFPKIETSQDIHALFEHIIFEQIRLFKPSIIFVSYNGELNIIEDHFTDIVKNLSIICDHRLVLFTNFTHLFQQQDFVMDEEEEQLDKIMCSHDFYQKYFEYRLQHVNEERLYANLSIFLKYAPGIYNMEDRVYGSPFCKYSMGRFYQYLQALSKLQQFKWAEQHKLHKWNSSQLMTLYDQYQRCENKQNKKQNKYYEKMLNVIISEFLCRNIDESKLQVILGKAPFYRLKFIVDELLKEQQELRMAKIEFNGSHQSNNSMQQQERDVSIKLLEAYFESQKERLLSQNLQNYKIKKHFYLGENQKSFGHVSCLKFILNGGQDGEQIYLQKYSQLIINEEEELIFVINYKSIDNRHMILQGSTKNSQIEREIILTEVKQTEVLIMEEVKGYLLSHQLNQEGLKNQMQDIVYVQYNYCFHDEFLYLYWPLEWNLKDQARCKLLGIQYKPKRVFKMLRVFQHEHQERFKYQNIKYEPDDNQVEVLPRWGCASKAISQNSFLILGGIYDNQNDFKLVGSGIYRVQVRQTQYNKVRNKTFKIYAEPKSKTKSDSVVCLKPKINYMMRNGDDKTQSCTIIYGGYGRQNTSFYNLFSYDQYLLDSSRSLHKVNQTKFNRRIVSTEKPLQINKVGKYNVILNNYNISIMEQKFSDAPKDKIIFEKKSQGAGKSNQWEIVAFIDEAYRANQFKTDPKKLFLFGFDRTVRQKIYLKCWSPQMYVVDGVKEYIINLSLKTQKTSSYIITNYLMPREEDMVSLCLEQDKLYLLSNSPIIHSIQRAGLKFVLYEGSLTNINQVIRKREIQMIARHNFDEKYEKFLYDKTLFLHQDKIYLVGGSACQQEIMGKLKLQREDYILEPIKNKFKIKTRKIQTQPMSLQMPNSFVVKQNEHYYIYSILFEVSPTGIDLSEGIEWKLKIQKHIFQNNEGNQVRCGGMRTYALNKNTNHVQRYAHSNVDEPKFVKITPYTRFNVSVLREYFTKIVWRIDKNQFLQKQANLFEMVKVFHNEANDKLLEGLLENQWGILQALILMVKNKLDAGHEANHEEQQLLKDLKHAYFLVSKMILEKHMFLDEARENEYMFIVEDKSSRKVKYLAIGPLNTTKLNFFRMRFKHELSTCLNQQKQDNLFYHPTMPGYYKFDYEHLKAGDQNPYSCQEIVRPLSIIIKQ